MDQGLAPTAELLATVRHVFAVRSTHDLPTITPDYLELRAIDLGPVPTAGAARLLTAARIGPARLIDNVAIDLGGSG
jgi:pantothenate synthetase